MSTHLPLFPIAVAPGIPLLCPAFVLDDLTVREQNPALDDALAALGMDYRERFAELPLSELPGIQSVRATYRALGVDPTKTRPSSEALLRRVLRGDALYRINTLVDALNYCSLKYLVPFGLYDMAQVRPPVELRVGREGEGYAGIRKERVNVAGRACLADLEGPFGNPTSDSDRAKITLATTRALVAPFLPADTPADHVERIAGGSAELLRRFV